VIGQTISHYKILKKLGEGGMGVVYEAEDTKLDRIVALKFLPHHLTANDAEKSRLLQEAKAASALNHPNVCTIYDIKEEDEQQFIVMEYIDGRTVRQLLPVKKLSEAYSYAIQIGEGLQEAHAKGIVHRDIKADNIMINSKNQIKIMDFGLAKLKGSLKLTQTPSTVGTLAYMAPEQIQGSEVDARSDIFSFGVVLFEMVTGHLPFRGEHEAAMMYSIINEEHESLQKYLPEATPELLHIINTALEKNSEDRYQAVSEMVRDIRRLQKQSTKLSRTSLSSMPVSLKDSISENSPAVAPVVPQKSSSIKILWLVIIFLVVGIVFVLYKFITPNPLENGREPFQSIKIMRLTTSGKASIAAISPDGKYVVHVVVEGERRSLWMRQVATTSNIMIVPPADVVYRGITFNKDGNSVYYIIIDYNNPNGALFEIPVLGGTSRKILSDLATAVTHSPDGKQFAFIRQYHAVGEEVLMIVNADGSGERKLAVRRGDEFFITARGVAPSWSPDGKLIAMPAASNKGVQHINIMEYAVTDGSEKLLSTENWGAIGKITWCSDGRGIIFVGRRGTSSNSQLWYLRYPDGIAHSITNDLSDYHHASLGVTANTTSLVSTNVEVRSNIWILEKSESGKGIWGTQKAMQITSGTATHDGLSGVAWTPDHKIVYTSSSSGTEGLWIIDKDGSNQHQLTLGTHHEFNPSVSADGKFIIYVSDKDTTPHIWRMEIDGGNPTIFSKAEDYSPSVTPDGKWFVYSGWATGKTLIYKIPLAGGDSINVSTNPATNPRVSPDGRLILCGYFDEENRKWRVALLAFDGGGLQKLFTLPNSASDGSLDWFPDGKSITYIDTRNGVSNIWSMPPNGGKPRQLTDFATGLIFQYAWSKDGKYLAVARGQETSDVVLITDNK
jgi:eukaryotic-like serine/threonine-protein kinase